LTEAEMNDRLEQYRIPVDLPLVVQVSRFDRWKDPQGVVEAFKLAQKEVDATLVLLGNFATDDPEGAQVYEHLAIRARRGWQLREDRNHPKRMRAWSVWLT
jgi:trehalose synthase